MIKQGIVYTETVVHAAPALFVADAPYQLAIIVGDEGARATVRIKGDRVEIGDRVEFVEEAGGIPFYQRAS